MKVCMPLSLLSFFWLFFCSAESTEGYLYTQADSPSDHCVTFLNSEYLNEFEEVNQQPTFVVRCVRDSWDAYWSPTENLTIVTVVEEMNVTVSFLRILFQNQNWNLS